MAKEKPKQFREYIDSGDLELTKAAEDTVNEFIRAKMREDGFFRKIMPPVPLWLPYEIGIYVQLLLEGRWVNGVVREHNDSGDLVVETKTGALTVNVLAARTDGTIRLHRASQVLYEQWKEEQDTG